MHALYLWLLWLKTQLEKPDANPVRIRAEHLGAFMMARSNLSHETALWFKKDAKQKAIHDSCYAVLAHFNMFRLNKNSRAKGLRLVTEAVSALEAAGYHIPF